MEKKKKNIWIILIIAILIVACVVGILIKNNNKDSVDPLDKDQTGWSEDESKKESSDEPESLKIVCADFAEYDWVLNITSSVEEFDVELLNESGTDMHSYQPTIEDLAKISDCDVFIYAGGLSENWVNEALSGVASKDCTVISLMDVFEKSELYNEYEDNDDEHVWTSIRLAEYFINYLCDTLAPKSGHYYDKMYYDCEDYISYLHELYDVLNAKIEQVVHGPVVMADRMPFYYLFEDLGVTCVAAFDGCSAETEASFDTVISLANTIDENELKYVLVIENSDTNIADTVISTAELNPEIIEMNSLQSVTKDDIENGMTYAGALEENVKAILKAVN